MKGTGLLPCGCEANRLNCLKEELWVKYGSSIWDESEFPPDPLYDSNFKGVFHSEIPKRLIGLYSHRYQTVLDCFAGSGKTNLMAKLLERNSIGIEVNPKYADTIIRKLNEIEDTGTTHKIIEGDSRYILPTLNSDSVDLIVTSPPYFNIIDYSEDYSGRDMGNIDDYKEFIEQIEIILQENYRVLKENKYCCWVVGDPMSTGFRPLSFDIVEIARKADFEISGTFIKANPSNLFGSGDTPGSIQKTKESDGSEVIKFKDYPNKLTVNPIHETILVFKK